VAIAEVSSSRARVHRGAAAVQQVASGSRRRRIADAVRRLVAVLVVRGPVADLDVARIGFPSVSVQSSPPQAVLRWPSRRRRSNSRVEGEIDSSVDCAEVGGTRRSPRRQSCRRLRIPPPARDRRLIERRIPPPLARPRAYARVVRLATGLRLVRHCGRGRARRPRRRSGRSRRSGCGVRVVDARAGSRAVPGAVPRTSSSCRGLAAVLESRGRRRRGGGGGARVRARNGARRPTSFQFAPYPVVRAISHVRAAERRAPSPYHVGPYGTSTSSPLGSRRSASVRRARRNGAGRRRRARGALPRPR